MIDFLNPVALWLLLAIPAFIVLFAASESARQRALAKIGDQRLVENLVRRISVKGRRTRTGLWLLAVFALVIAMARPVSGVNVETIYPIGAEVIFLIDVSLSMAAPDLAPSRLVRALLDASELAQMLQGTAFGIVAFAGVAVPFMPPTTDLAALNLFLNSLSTDFIAVQGTSLAAGLTASLAAFDDNPASPSVIVLLTDGEDHEGQIDVALLALIENRTPVFALGYGTEQGSTIPTINPTNQVPEFKRDANGGLVITRLQLHKLEEIAAATGGLAFRAEQPEALVQIANQIRTYQGDTLQPQRIARPIEYFPAPLLLAVLLLLASFVQPVTSKAETV